MNRLQGYMGANTRPRLISILSGKGGVGKSVLALNLAERLAETGRRVLLVDLDLSGGNLHILANVTAQAGLSAYLSGALPLGATLTPLSDQLSLLANNEPLTVTEYPNGGQAARLAHRLRTDTARYDLVLCDHASGVSEFATEIAGASDLNLLVAVPEVTSISDCYGLWKYFCGMNRTITGRLLINRAENDNEAQYVAHRLAALTEQFVGRPLEMLGFIPEDSSLRQAVAAQCPVAAIAPESVVIQKLNDITRLLVGGPQTTKATALNQTINVNAATADIKG